MKTAIVYVSTHHGNTKKLVDAIAQKHEIVAVDAAAQKDADLSGFDLIGFASGVAFGKYYPQLLSFMESNLPEHKRVFFLHTAGDPREAHNAAAKAIADARGCTCLGTYFCKGFDTYGPFKLVGGLNKNRPNADEVAGAEKFFADIEAAGNTD